MTEVTSTSTFTTFAHKFFSAGNTEIHFVDPQYHRAYQKRYWTQLSCSRLQESGFPGADLAVEHVYDKYIRDLSTSTIQQSGRVILYFLHFLEREETNIFALSRQARRASKNKPAIFFQFDMRGWRLPAPLPIFRP